MPNDLYSGRNTELNRYASFSPFAGSALPTVTGSTGNPLGSPDMTTILNQAIPGFSGLTKSATDVIGNLLTGMPSPDLARQENAYFGARSGLGSSNTDPTHDFLRNRGFDLYGAKAEGRRQTGLEDLMKFLGTYSGAAVPTTGQVQQGGQFQQDFAFRQQQAAIENALKQRQLEMQQQETDARYGGNPNNVGYWSGVPPGQSDFSRIDPFYSRFTT